MRWTSGLQLSSGHSPAGASWVLTLDIVHFTQRVVQDGVLTLELEVPTELLLLQQQWEPVAVIRPHVTKRDLVQWEPLRAHFCHEGRKGRARAFSLDSDWPMRSLGRALARSMAGKL